jgi:hypothetical protein
MKSMRRIKDRWLIVALLTVSVMHAVVAQAVAAPLPQPAPQPTAQPTPVEPARIAPVQESGPPIAEPDIGQAAAQDDDPAAITHMNSQQIIAVLGNQVRFDDGSDVGRIVDILVDRSGNPVSAVLDCGGFMGVGNRKVAVSWASLHFSPQGEADGSIVTDLSPGQVRSAPEYREASDAEIVTTRGAAKIAVTVHPGELAKPGNGSSSAASVSH